ncbi:hypothetical protein [Streptomyces sp. Z26]|nr:hypothetical protein [Streptomyces sp. Z26]
MTDGTAAAEPERWSAIAWQRRHAPALAQPGPARQPGGEPAE